MSENLILAFVGGIIGAAVGEWLNRRQAAREIDKMQAVIIDMTFEVSAANRRAEQAEAALLSVRATSNGLTETVVPPPPLTREEAARRLTDYVLLATWPHAAGTVVPAEVRGARRVLLAALFPASEPKERT